MSESDIVIYRGLFSSKTSTWLLLVEFTHCHDRCVREAVLISGRCFVPQDEHGIHENHSY